MHPLIGWRDTAAATGTSWRPRALAKAEWPPDYNAVWRWRTATLLRLRSDPLVLASAYKYYSTRPSEFIMHWMDTYDPRRATGKWIPFVFFEKQVDLVDFIESLDRDQESGLIEKSRDMGATWVLCGYSVWRWIFKNGDNIGWGSRKEQLVDKLGDPDSIFEKMRLLIKRLPSIWIPDGFKPTRHATYMKLANPDEGNTITGEAGDNIGRGGRSSIYIKDEAAHYERPEKIESALGDNTNVQIDLSSVNGVGNVFHRRRENGIMWAGKDAAYKPGFVRVFIMDWKDHPLKTQTWYDTRKAKYEREGMAHIFAQEVDRNYSAAVSNTVIPYEWITSAVDAHIHIPYVAAAYPANAGKWLAGLDVADEGEDFNSYSEREWIIWRYCEEWGERDPGVTARRAINLARRHRGRIRVMYDSIGMGAIVKSEYNRLVMDDKVLEEWEIPFVPWNAGASVINPYAHIIEDDDESLTNFDFFGNLKAQAWWSLRTRFFKTHKARTEGVKYDPDELISLDSNMPLLEQVMKQLAQPTHGQGAKLRMIVNKKPPGTKSPNDADGGVMMYFPVEGDDAQITVGKYGH